MTSQIEQRKSEHVAVVLTHDVAGAGITTGFERIRFAHVALPEIALSDVDLSTSFLGRKLSAPLLISSMTGGPVYAASINHAIAEAANVHGIAFGVGSQRIALEEGAGHGFDRSLRSTAPDVPILANFGAAQLNGWDGPDMVRRAVDMIEADAVIIHLNALQEAVQPGGDTDWRGLLHQIERLSRASPVPIVVKEVGFGITGQVARRLWDAGVEIIDVAGAGGTNWASVEAERAQVAADHEVAAAFAGWGVPTLECVLDVRAQCPDATIIASGGLKNGIDCAKALRAGADLAGVAAGVLAAATEGAEALSARLDIIIRQLRITCFATGSANLASLRRAELQPLGLEASEPTRRVREATGP